MDEAVEPENMMHQMLIVSAVNARASRHQAERVGRRVGEPGCGLPLPQLTLWPESHEHQEGSAWGNVHMATDEQQPHSVGRAPGIMSNCFNRDGWCGAVGAGRDLSSPPPLKPELPEDELVSVQRLPFDKCIL
ncbi:hypothetical protein EYF80_020093 [Liparis tanakae]|uniref:Uncharacterized protein n=1 Tax=Liparis tanakae TaxID=230148 RepID=A0A4Z2HV67_9TELE|nr:hypothetical protein EYF80_020093 [Liparis tanakae]